MKRNESTFVQSTSLLHPLQGKLLAIQLITDRSPVGLLGPSSIIPITEVAWSERDHLVVTILGRRHDTYMDESSTVRNSK
jgi:hypothetical protein